MSVPPHRLLHIVNALNEHRKLTAAKLATELEVSERTVKRYIAYMRNELGIEIIWEPTTRTYFCDRPYEYLPLLRFTCDEALSLALASKTFAAWQGTALGKALESVLTKVGQVVGGSVSIPVTELQSFLSSPQLGREGDREHTWFAPLLQAIRRKRELTVRYKKPTASRAYTRLLWPLHLAFLDHHWALVFWDPRRKGLRKFLLDRMESMEQTGQRFEPPEAFDLQAYLRNSFGLFTGDEIHEVAILFDAVAAPYIRERQWHPSQMIEEWDEEKILVRYQVNHLMDMQRWVLSWGSHAEVLRPKKLRDALTEEARLLIQQYGNLGLIVDDAQEPLSFSDQLQ